MPTSIRRLGKETRKFGEKRARLWSVFCDSCFAREGRERIAEEGWIAEQRREICKWEGCGRKGVKGGGDSFTNDF